MPNIGTPENPLRVAIIGAGPSGFYAAGHILSPSDPSPEAIEQLLAEKNVRYVSFEDWQAIDQAEVGRGEPHGRPRVKFVRVEEMLDAVGEGVVQ